MASHPAGPSFNEGSRKSLVIWPSYNAGIRLICMMWPCPHQWNPPDQVALSIIRKPSLTAHCALFYLIFIVGHPNLAGRSVRGNDHWGCSYNIAMRRKCLSPTPSIVNSCVQSPRILQCVRTSRVALLTNLLRFLDSLFWLPVDWYAR